MEGESRTNINKDKVAMKKIDMFYRKSQYLHPLLTKNPACQLGVVRDM